MSLYKEIHLDNLDVIINESLNLFPDNKKDKTSLFYIDNNRELFLKIPELKNNLDRLELTDHVYGFGFYIVFNNSPLGIHHDNGDIIYSLNLPLSGCKNTYVNFYRSSSQAEELLTMAGNKYFAYKKEDCELIDRLELTSPYIINVKVPHAVVNKNNEPRITLLIRLNTTVGELF